MLVLISSLPRGFTFIHMHIEGPKNKHCILFYHLNDVQMHFQGPLIFTIKNNFC